MDFQTNGTSEGTVLYTYQPSPAAATIYIVLFGIAGVVHFSEMVWLKTAYSIPLVIGCIMEAFGYYGRLWSSRSPKNFGAFTLQSFMLILAPLFLSATLYMSLSRVINTLVPPALERRNDKGSRSCCFRCCCCLCVSLSARLRQPGALGFLSPCFMLGDMACFLTQLCGLGLQVTTSAATRQTGRTVLLVGLVLQCVVTGVFLAVALQYTARLQKKLTPSRPDNADPGAGANTERVVAAAAAAPPPPPRWQNYLYALIAAAGLLMLRNMVRVVEYAQGAHGLVQGHEVFTYLFDGSMMLGMLLALGWWHGGRLNWAVVARSRQA